VLTGHELDFGDGPNKPGGFNPSMAKPKPGGGMRPHFAGPRPGFQQPPPPGRGGPPPPPGMGMRPPPPQFM
jgi:formin 2